MNEKVLVAIFLIIIYVFLRVQGVTRESNQVGACDSIASYEEKSVSEQLKEELKSLFEEICIHFNKVKLLILILVLLFFIFKNIPIVILAIELMLWSIRLFITIIKSIIFEFRDNIN